jgi:hypothetical protein
MAKKQTRRSISVSRVTYERLKAFCEANNISMSQFVETRVGDFLGETPASTPAPRPSTPRPFAPLPPKSSTAPVATPAVPARPAAPVPMTAASARFAVEPPPPIIKKVDHDSPAPAPIVKTADQIFTF